MNRNEVIKSRSEVIKYRSSSTDTVLTEMYPGEELNWEQAWREAKVPCPADGVFPTRSRRRRKRVRGWSTAQVITDGGTCTVYRKQDVSYYGDNNKWRKVEVTYHVPDAAVDEWCRLHWAWLLNIYAGIEMLAARHVLIGSRVPSSWRVSDRWMYERLMRAISPEGRADAGSAVKYFVALASREEWIDTCRLAPIAQHFGIAFREIQQPAIYIKQPAIIEEDFMEEECKEKLEKYVRYAPEAIRDPSLEVWYVVRHPDGRLLVIAAKPDWKVRTWYEIPDVGA